MVNHEFIATDEDENVCVLCPRPAKEHFAEVSAIYDEDELLGSDHFDVSKYGFTEEW